MRAVSNSFRIYPDEGCQLAIDVLATVDCAAFHPFAERLAEFLHDFCQRLGDFIVPRVPGAAGAGEAELRRGGAMRRRCRLPDGTAFAVMALLISNVMTSAPGDSAAWIAVCTIAQVIAVIVVSRILLRLATCARMSRTASHPGDRQS